MDSKYLARFFGQFQWHSSVGFDTVLSPKKRIIKKIANTLDARSQFLVASDNFLVHKATHALWKVSEDGKSIEALFDDDVLTSDQLEGEKDE